MPRSSLSAFAATVAIACAPAQTTHVVGPGGFSQVSTALAAAAPGDVIVVHPGSYNPFTATIGVTIRAVTSGTVQFPWSQAVCTVSCPPPQTVHLVDLGFQGVSVQGGSCSLDRCHVTQAIGGPALLASNARVCLQDCNVGMYYQTIWGGDASGLRAMGATISAIDTTFRGMDCHYGFGYPASPGVKLTNSTFHGSGVTIEGGDGYSAWAQPPPEFGLFAVGSVVWLSDATVRGGRTLDLPGTPRVCPIAASGPLSGGLSRCTLDPATCPPAVATNGDGIGVHRAGPWRSGTSFTLTTHCAPNAFVGVFASPDLETGAILLLPQPVLLGLATVSPVALMQADAVGLASASWTLPAGTADLRMWLQAAAAGTGPLQVSPVAGGVVRP